MTFYKKKRKWSCKCHDFGQGCLTPPKKKNIATEKVKAIVANMCYSFILDIDLKLIVGE